MKQTCYEMLTANADRKGNVVYYNHKISIQKLLRDTENLAFAFSRLNLKKGDVVTVYLPSCPQGLAAFYACSKLGLVANIVHPLVPVKLLKENLVKVHSKALLFYDVLLPDERQLADANQILVRCSIADYVTFRKPVFALYSAVRSHRIKGVLTYNALRNQCGNTQVCGSEDDVVCYMHSGGTSGTPKIVKLTNAAFNGIARSMKLLCHPTEDIRAYNLATLPIFHAFGLCAGVHAPLVLGYGVILVPKFDVNAVCRYLKNYRITCWSVVPAMIKKMFSAGRFDTAGMENMDVIWCGGDVLDESLVEKADEVLHRRCKRAQLMRGYGLTEVCGVCTVNNFDNYQKESCGKPMPLCKVEIWDEEGNVLPYGVEGEIAVNSLGNMQGYLDGGGLVEKNGESWVTSGDIGYLDEKGFLHIVDRKKRSLKIAAVNVFPAQVENCVKKLSFVDEACAVRCNVNDKPYLKVFVTLNTPTPLDVVKKSVEDICSANLIRYSVPRFVEVLDKMPRTDFGKIDYVSLEKR